MRQSRPANRSDLAAYYRKLADGEDVKSFAESGKSGQPVGNSLRPWCNEFARALTPQMIDHFCHMYLNDSVSAAAFRRAYQVLDEVIYRFAFHTIIRGQYRDWAAEYPLVAENFTIEDFRIFLARHVPITCSSSTFWDEYHCLRELLLAAGKVSLQRMQSAERVKAETLLEERHREEMRLRHAAAESEKIRQAAEAQRQHEIKMAELKLKIEQEAAENRRAERYEAMQDEINDIKTRNFPQHIEDQQIEIVRNRYGDLNGTVEPAVQVANTAE
jgi:hypothetical protein